MAIACRIGSVRGFAFRYFEYSLGFALFLHGVKFDGNGIDFWVHGAIFKVSLNLRIFEHIYVNGNVCS
jgi:hypothetical protein